MRSTNSALLVMDVQTDTVNRVVGDDAPPLLHRLQAATTTARDAGVLVVYIRVAFRDGYPEISPRNRTFSAISSTGRLTQRDTDTQVHPELAPLPTDIVVTKLRRSAFTGSDLDVILRARDIETLVLTGIATSGVVLATASEAVDRDYQVIVLSDGCADADAEVHRVLTEKVFRRWGDVLTVAEWISDTANRQ